MTVLVTGASGVVGHSAVKALLARDEVRAIVRRPEAAEPLRALGAKVAVRDVREIDDLTEILPRCHTLVHLIGGPDQPTADELFWANHGSARLAVDAARDAGTERLILLSVPGASIDQPHPFLRAKGLAEEVVETSGLDFAIVRATHVYGLGGLWFTALVHGAVSSPPMVCGPGTQALAPVYADDLGAVIAAMDDHAGSLEHTWGLEGPDVVTADALVAILRDDDEPPVHTDGQPAAKALTELLGRPVDAVTASWFGMPNRAEPPDAAAAFGVARTGLSEGLRATLADAAALGEG
jgi:NADH dehydrogenase